MNGMSVVRAVAGQKQIKRVGAIIFGTQRPALNPGLSRRFFAPVRNVIGSAVESSNPRAILRMVSGYC